MKYFVAFITVLFSVSTGFGQLRPEFQQHIDWCWENRHEMIVVATQLAKTGDHDPALKQVFECQKHNPKAASILKANSQGVLDYLVYEYGHHIRTKPEFQQHIDWCWENRHEMIVQATLFAKAGDHDPALKQVFECQKHNPKTVSILKANSQGVLDYLVYEYGPNIRRRPEFQQHIDWCWENRREMTVQATLFAKAGDRDPALRSVYECQKHNPDAVSVLKVNWQDALDYLVYEYGPELPEIK
jgi:hypothetical protein